MAESSDDLQKALEKLLRGGGGWAPFEKKQPVGGRLGGLGVGLPSSGTGGGGGGGFAESDASLREYYADRVITTSDGVFTSVERHIKSIALAGGGRATFDEPPA